MRFTKMHGLGNDYVYVNGFEQTVDDPAALAVAVSHRHTAIGSDGLIMILPSEAADVRMRMFNADGSEAQMCGNGVRCVAKYSYDHGLTGGHEPTESAAAEIIRFVCGDAEAFREITVQTGRGVLTLELAIYDGRVEQVCVNMGQAILKGSEIPVTVDAEPVVDVPIEANGQSFEFTAVSMGNPHAVIFCDDVQAVELETIGPVLEHHAMFPERINVHFVQRVSERELIMRTWERGSGITLACGTGAAAVCVAAVLTHRTVHNVLIHLPGGDLRLAWDQRDGHVYMTGPATEVFSGDWPA